MASHAQAEISRGAFKGWLDLGALLLLAFAVIFALWVNISQIRALDHDITTWQTRALRQPTAAEFAEKVGQFRQALNVHGMLSGPSSLGGSPDTHAEVVHDLLARLQARAEVIALEKSSVVDADVTLALTEVKHDLQSVHFSPYGYWLWSQGGVFLALWVPLGAALGAVLLWGVGLNLPIGRDNVQEGAQVFHDDERGNESKEGGTP